MQRRDFLRGTAGLIAASALPGFALGSVLERSAAASGILVVRNAHTGERVELEYADGRGRLKRDALLALRDLWRDWRTGERFPIDPRLPFLLDEIAAGVGRPGSEIVLLSGFRSEKTNRRVGGAKHSQHLIGAAADVHLPGVSLRRLRDAAKEAQAGGVGYYPGSRFLHVDTGSVRYWKG